MKDDDFGKPAAHMTRVDKKPSVDFLLPLIPERPDLTAEEYAVAFAAAGMPGTGR